jgi:hypothetical protein
VTERADETPAETPTARAEASLDTLDEGTRMVDMRFKCKVCEEPFRYGDMVIKTPHHGILCETCMRSEKIESGEAVVFGSVDKKPSTIDRQRAQRNLKRLARSHKRAKNTP